MTCAEARQHWHLYHDSEGDVALHAEVAAHLADCPTCAEWFHLQSQLERQIAAHLATDRADPGLWARVLASAGAGPLPTRSGGRPGGRGALAVATFVASVGLLVWWFSPNRRDAVDTGLARATAGLHERVQSGREPFEFASTSDREVEEYFKGRVPFPVRCPPRADAGFFVRGAGVTDIDGQPAAYLRGRVGGTAVSVLVLPRAALDAFPAQRAALRQYGIVHAPAGAYATVLREFDQNAVVVVGAADPAALARVINAYGSYPEHE